MPETWLDVAPDPGDNTIVFENLAKSDSRVSHWFMIAGAEIRRVEE